MRGAEEWLLAVAASRQHLRTRKRVGFPLQSASGHRRVLVPVIGAFKKSRFVHLSAFQEVDK